MAKNNIAFIHILRAVAVLLVVYCHLIGYSAPADFAPKAFVVNFLETPLHIIWHFGFLGVALFFLISGFIITHVSQQETRTAFLVKRLFRIFPTMLVSILFSACMLTVAGVSYEPDSVLRALTLFNSGFKIEPQTYTLIMELYFYAEIFLFFPLMKSRPLFAAMLIAIAAPISVLVAHRLGASPHFRLVNYFSFTPTFSFGMIIYCCWTKRIGAMSAFIAATCVSVLFALSLVQTHGMELMRSFTMQVAYAAIIFVLGLLLNKRLYVGRLSGWLGDISYSLYLFHIPLGIIVINLLAPRTGYSAALCVALLSVFLISTISYFVIDRAMQRLARRILIARIDFRLRSSREKSSRQVST